MYMYQVLEYEQYAHAIKAGFKSLMIDDSHLPLEENIALTKKVVELAHIHGVSVEAELGRIGGEEDDLVVDDARSEEHTSELQSRGHLVCRLLLEKKKISYY